MIVAVHIFVPKYDQGATALRSGWSANEAWVVTMLNIFAPIETDPHGYDPAPHMTAAEKAMSRLGAKITSIEETADEPGVVY